MFMKTKEKYKKSGSADHRFCGLRLFHERSDGSQIANALVRATKSAEQSQNVYENKGQVLKSLTVLIALALVAGIVYEQIGRRRDRARLPQIGKSVNIGGRSLNIFCSGAGEPPVIFESGGAGPGLGWEPFQTEVAKFTQACWYDRAGEGWSDLGPFPRTSVAIANDLHELLNRAGVPAPYVFAGGFFGGLNSRICRKTG